MSKKIITTWLLLLGGSSAFAANVTWVSFHGTDGPSEATAAVGLTEAADIGYTNLLSEDGHSVTRFLTHEPLTEDDLNLLNGSDLVIISRSVSSGHYDPPTDWNTKVTSPVIAMSGYILRSNRLNLTDGTTMVDTAEPLTLSADDPSHPVFDGVDIGNPFAEIVTWDDTVQRGVSINMAEIVGGKVIATSTEAATAGGPVIAEWEAGATLNNGEILAGPRMAFVSGSREVGGVTSETAGFYDLTADGATMFLNAVNHMAVPEPSSSMMVVCGAALLGLFRRREAK